MNKIVILGSGVAALTLSYHFIKAGNAVRIVSPDKTFNIKTEGARFLHDVHTQPVDNLIAECGKVRESRELTGGVIHYQEGEETFYDWSTLCKDFDLRESLSHSYADSTGRVWTESIMNNLINTSEIPFGLISPTYADLILFMKDIVESSSLFTYSSMQVKSISIIEQVIRPVNIDEIDIEYDLLINTIPFWVFKDLFEVYMPVKRDLKFSKPRYASKAQVMSDEFSMTYYAGPDIVGVTGFPIKRKSVIDGVSILEFYEKPDLPVLTKLPPNIVDTPKEDWDQVLSHLIHHNIILLGRFAQIKSKMMFTDIIDESYKITNIIKNTKEWYNAII